METPMKARPTVPPWWSRRAWERSPPGPPRPRTLPATCGLGVFRVERITEYRIAFKTAC